MPFTAKYLSDLTPDQLAALKADPALYEAFEAGLAPLLPKPVGVCFSGMAAEPWVPVAAVFGNAERAVRMARKAQQVAA